VYPGNVAVLVEAELKKMAVKIASRIVPAVILRPRGTVARFLVDEPVPDAAKALLARGVWTLDNSQNLVVEIRRMMQDSCPNARVWLLESTLISHKWAEQWPRVVKVANSCVRKVLQCAEEPGAGEVVIRPARIGSSLAISGVVHLEIANWRVARQFEQLWAEMLTGMGVRMRLHSGEWVGQLQQRSAPGRLTLGNVLPTVMLSDAEALIRSYVQWLR
jgi:hypothetical protein